MIFLTGTSHIHFSVERVNKRSLDTLISTFLEKNIEKYYFTPKNIKI